MESKMADSSKEIPYFNQEQKIFTTMGSLDNLQTINDGTLIELVETHKVPILKKIGWYLDLKKRKNNTPLPKWMIKLMGLSKVN